MIHTRVLQRNKNEQLKTSMKDVVEPLISLQQATRELSRGRRHSGVRTSSRFSSSTF